MTNNSKNNSIINSRLSKYKVQINLKYPASPQTKNNSMDKSNDILINIKTKLKRDNDYINNKRFIFRNSLDDKYFDNKNK